MSFPLLHDRSVYNSDAEYYNAIRFRYKALLDDFVQKRQLGLCSDHFHELNCLLFDLRYWGTVLGDIPLTPLPEGSQYGYNLSQIHYNISYSEDIGEEVSGVINGNNKVFTVSKGKYQPGTLQVFREGQQYWDGHGILETDPENGVFTFESYAPQPDDAINVRYHIGDTATQFTNTYLNGAYFNPVDRKLYLERKDSSTIVVDMSNFTHLFIDGLQVDKGYGNSDLKNIQVGDKIVGWIGDTYVAGTVTALPYTDIENINQAIKGSSSIP